MHIRANFRGMLLSEFTINCLPVGKGELAITPIPGRAAPDGLAWQRLIGWRPTLVISMTEQTELDRSGMASLGADLAQHKIAWMHAPVPDLGTPDGLDWPLLRDHALGQLASGGRVLVHCFAGCGRSGMMVLRLMIAAGEAPEEALERLRNVRPCAVETDQQMAWAQLGY